MATTSRGGGGRSRRRSTAEVTEVVLYGPIIDSPSPSRSPSPSPSPSPSSSSVEFLEEIEIERSSPESSSSSSSQDVVSSSPSPRTSPPPPAPVKHAQKNSGITKGRNSQTSNSRLRGTRRIMVEEKSNRRDDEEVLSGLINVEDNSRLPIPLISVNVEAQLVHVIAEVKVIQVYQNKETKTIEAVYYFPTNPEGAVTHFEAEVDGQVIMGKVKPNEEAQADYDTAVRNKKTAFLGEETGSDIFKLRVGYLKPGSQAKVTLKYATEVKNDPGLKAIRFYIPTTVAPRHVSPESETTKKGNDMKRMKFSKKSSTVPLSISADILLHGGIDSVQSPSHQVKVSISRAVENSEWATAFVELVSNTTEMDRDFVVNIIPRDVHQPSLYTAQKPDGSTAAMLHLIPSVQLESQKPEIIFVLDRSGSMKGPSITLARQALQLFISSMPADCYFNIVGFGWTFNFLFPGSRKYDDRTKLQAIRHAERVEADLGGTELLQPLRKIFSKPTIQGYFRNIFVLTDGQVENTERVIGLVRAETDPELGGGRARVFSLGIGEAACHQLVEGLASAGGGTSAFVGYNESFHEKVLHQLKICTQKSTSGIELEWEGITRTDEPPPINTTRTLMGFNKPLPSTPVVAELCLDNLNQQSPKRISPIRDGSQMLVFGLFKSRIPTAVTIKAMAPDGPLTLRVEKSQAEFAGSTELIHTLAAVKLIRELELEAATIQSQEEELSVLDPQSGDSPGDKLKREIIQLACQSGISSRYTSFVAVDPSDDDRPCSDSWVMRTREVPNQLATGWGGVEVNLRSRPTKTVGSAQEREGARACLAKKTKVPRRSAPYAGVVVAPRFKKLPHRYRPQPRKSSHSSAYIAKMRAAKLGGGPPARPRGRPRKYPSNGDNGNNVSHNNTVSSSLSFDESGSGSEVEEVVKMPNLTSASPRDTGKREGSMGSYVVKKKALPKRATKAATMKPRCRGGAAPRPLSIPVKSARRISGEGTTNDSPESGEDALDIVVSLSNSQSTDGYWALADVAKVIGTALQVLKEGGQRHKLGDTVFATALAIVFLEGELAGEKASWEMFVDKAREWLARNLAKGQRLTGVLTVAREYI